MEAVTEQGTTETETTKATEPTELAAIRTQIDQCFFKLGKAQFFADANSALVTEASVQIRNLDKKYADIAKKLQKKEAQAVTTPEEVVPETTETTETSENQVQQ